MTWYENKISPVEWENILNKLHIRSFKSLDDGYSKIHIKTKSLKLIYKKNNNIKSICNAKYLNKFGIYFVNIDGGIEGEISPTILKELILFFKNKFFFFIIKIDHQSIEDSEIFKKIGFIDISNMKRYEQIKEFNLIKNEQDLINSFSQYWRRNYKRSKRYSLKIVNNDFNFKEELISLFEELSKLKKIKNNYNYFTLSSIYQNFKNNLFVSKAYIKDELVSLRAIIFFKDQCWDLLSATSNLGRKNYSSYAVTFEILKFCYINKISKYYLSGVDPIYNKSVYNFKKGMGSKTIEIPNEKIYSNIFFLNSFYFFLKSFFK